jgi:hypothetical protein
MSFPSLFFPILSSSLPSLPARPSSRLTHFVIRSSPHGIAHPTPRGYRGRRCTTPRRHHGCLRAAVAVAPVRHRGRRARPPTPALALRVPPSGARPPLQPPSRPSRPAPSAGLHHPRDPAATLARAQRRTTVLKGSFDPFILKESFQAGSTGYIPSWN